MIVRKPGPNELDSTLILIEYQRDELEIADYNSDAVAHSAKTHMTKATHLWLNAYEGTRPVGCIGGCIAEDNWTGRRFAMINYFYVLSSHRDQGIYRELLKQFTEWAKSNECTRVVGGDIEVNYDGLFEGMGFQRKNIWIKE